MKEAMHSPTNLAPFALSRFARGRNHGIDASQYVSKTWTHCMVLSRREYYMYIITKHPKRPYDYASAAYAVMRYLSVSPSVCPSVCLSRSCILSKRI